jgi:hypothetical protein
MAVLHGRVTAQNGGFRPGQWVVTFSATFAFLLRRATAPAGPHQRERPPAGKGKPWRDRALALRQAVRAPPPDILVYIDALCP